MDFSSKLASPESIKTGALVVGVYADGTLTAAAKAVDTAAKGALKALIKSGDINGKRGSSVVLRELAGVAAARVVVLGLGKPEDFNDKALVESIRAAVKTAPAAKDIALAALDWTPRGRSSEWVARQLVLAAREAFFRVDEMKSKREDQPEPAKLVLLLTAKDAAADRGLKQGTAIANGIELTKRLANLPGNVCTPTYLADAAKAIAKEFKLRAEVLEQKQMEALKMGSLLSVAKGSTQAPKLIVLKYQGAAAKAAPVVLVGKGITFDSGGISLKPGAAMDEMKYDMGGAASVLGTMRAVAELGLKINLVALVPACENMPSGGASKPGDIVTSMSGQTIEILNTDAEGRLILCDALTYAERFKPAAVIDVATLTGACVVALGNVNSGLFSADDQLAAELSAAARDALDPAWRMPLDEDYQEQLKSNFADMANIGSPANAGAITAASFLARFTKAYPWAHLDIAGTAWKSGAAKGATGRPVGLLTRFLMERAG